MNAPSKPIILNPNRTDGCPRVMRTVDFVPTNPLRVGIVEHYAGDLSGFAEGARDARIIAVFDATEEGVAIAYKTLRDIEVEDC